MASLSIQPGCSCGRWFEISEGPDGVVVLIISRVELFYKKDNLSKKELRTWEDL
jgi:hypothetical protein